nr:carbohydrate porin [Fulvivirga aurantia]
MPVYNFRGGIKQGFRYIDNVDITANLDLETLFGLKNTSLFLYGLGNNGGYATELVGDIQTVSNIEAYPTWKLFEAWIQKNFFNNDISILAGLYDINSEFDVVKPGLLFVHSSYGMGAEFAQTGLNGPSTFPYTSLALRVSANIKERANVKFAVLDAVPGKLDQPGGTHIKLSKEEGALLVGQLNINLGSDVLIFNNDKSRKAGSIRRRAIGRGFESPNFNQIIIGGWRYTADFESLNGEQKRTGNQGFYIAYQRYFYLNAEQTKHITAFVRYGLAADEFNQIGSAFSGGLVSAVPLISADDQMGLAFSIANNGNTYEQTQQAENSRYDQAETNIEFTINHHLTPFVVLQPSVQYVINPGTAPELDNALVLLMLLQIEL